MKIEFCIKRSNKFISLFNNNIYDDYFIERSEREDQLITKAAK
jgi:hypothetical protein